MKKLIAAVVIGLASSSLAWSQIAAPGSEPAASSTNDKSAHKPPTEKQRAQQARFRDCSRQAAGRKGDERKTFMRTCLKTSAATTADGNNVAAQKHMKSCSKQASAQKLRGKARKTFMNGCLGRS